MNEFKESFVLDLNLLKKILLFLEDYFSEYLNLDQTYWSKNKNSEFYIPLNQVQTLDDLSKILQNIFVKFNKSYYYSESKEKDFAIKNNIWHFYILHVKYNF